MIEIEKNWEKHAAQTYSDKEVEQAFLDQAYMFIQNKATPLMKPPYRLGFEIVFKNDANSRMVGIFAFKVGDELLYAPVFFINGSVKGTDLLYRHKSKTFVPLTNDWAGYIIGLQESEVGEGLEKENTESSEGGLNMQKLIYPPSYGGQQYKFASYSAFVELNESLPAGDTVYEELKKNAGDALDEIVEKGQEEAEKAISKMQESTNAHKNKKELEEIADNKTDVTEKGIAVAKNYKKAGLLKQFILEDGGYDSVDKLVGAMEKNADFADAMVRLIGEENFLPKELNEETQEQVTKEASLVEDKSVTIHFGFLNENVKSANYDELAKKGYHVEDNRDADSIVEKVYKDDGKEFAGVDGPGIHELLAKDGKSIKCLVAPCNHRDLTLTYNNEWLDDRDSYDNPQHQKLVAIDMESGDYKSTDSKNLVTVNYNSEQVGSDPHLGSDADLDKLSDTPSTGNYYKMLDVSGTGQYDKTLSLPFYVKSKDSSSDGVDKYTIAYSKEGFGEGVTLILNPDYEGNDYNEKVFQKGSVAFIKVNKGGGNLSLGNNDDLSKLLIGGGVKKATVYKKGDYYVLREGEELSKELTKPEAFCSLVKNCSFSEALAYDVLYEARESDPFSFLYPITKEAHNLSFDDIPEFVSNMDSDFGIPKEGPQSATIVADSTKPEHREHRIGDSMKFDSAGDLGEKGPMELVQMADEMSVPSLFEHGVVGSLSKTYNSSLLIDKYLPDLEKALDRLGRMIFLFYWKPEDFSDLYGEDDQSGLENMLLSNFSSFGDMVLELLKKRKAFSESVGSTY